MLRNNKSMIKELRKEYENTPIPLEELLRKHRVEVTELKGFLSWQKNPSVALDKSSVLYDISQFKRLVVTKALATMKNAEVLDTKEVKDLVSIVDTIEKSYKKDTEETTNINLAVQKIISKFGDDC